MLMTCMQSTGAYTSPSLNIQFCTSAEVLFCRHIFTGHAIASTVELSVELGSSLTVFTVL